MLVLVLVFMRGVMGVGMGNVGIGMLEREMGATLEMLEREMGATLTPLSAVAFSKF